MQAPTLQVVIDARAIGVEFATPSCIISGGADGKVQMHDLRMPPHRAARRVYDAGAIGGLAVMYPYAFIADGATSMVVAKNLEREAPLKRFNVCGIVDWPQPALLLHCISVVHCMCVNVLVSCKGLDMSVQYLCSMCRRVQAGRPQCCLLVSLNAHS